MATLALAAEPVAKHEHNVHRRDENEVVTVVVTKHAFVPLDAAVNTPAISSSQASKASAEKPEASQSTVLSSVGFAPSDATSVLSSSGQAEPSASGKTTQDFQGNGGARGIVYSPYKVGGCKTAEEVKTDVAKLSGFSLIRIYGVDCNQVSNVLAALAPGQKLFLGVFDMTTIENDIKTINDAVQAHGQGWGVVDTISIGNELVNNGQASVDQIASYLETARKALASYSYPGKIVSVDTFIALINNPGLCKLSDYHAVNAHAFFDGLIEAAGSGDWLLEQISRIKNACNDGKEVFITESGWPSQGESNNKAIPSSENQKTAVESIKEKVGSSCILFTAFNDYWKDDGPFSAEKYYGILDS
ncbi:hypothetical protein D0Z00_002919 [Geotrichum galactomycetum]|uniref:Uncharacterized protein n=1 Tax=Geotrichum galactomycetum TaxID=27317 RepID=A0ACB6V2S5_9ASCO|nr:hypothetical protein D0Z00_002919 [Geotrichum candidum]